MPESPTIRLALTRRLLNLMLFLAVIVFCYTSNLFIPSAHATGEGAQTGVSILSQMNRRCLELKESDKWSWGCEVPALDFPLAGELFDTQGACGCDARVLKHKSTGLYRCESHKSSCGGVSFVKTLGYEPNLTWYDVVAKTPFSELKSRCLDLKGTKKWGYSCDVPAVDFPTAKTFFDKQGSCGCDGRILKHKVSGLIRCETHKSSCGGVGFVKTLGYQPNMNWYEEVTNIEDALTSSDFINSLKIGDKVDMRIRNTNGCELQWDGAMDSNYERNAKFDCADPSDEFRFDVLSKTLDPTTSLTTGVNGMLITHVKGGHCYLQWDSAISSDKERNAKFDCVHYGDLLTISSRGTEEYVIHTHSETNKGCGFEWAGGSVDDNNERNAKFDCKGNADPLELYNTKVTSKHHVADSTTILERVKKGEDVSIVDFAKALKASNAKALELKKQLEVGLDVDISSVLNFMYVVPSEQDVEILADGGVIYADTDTRVKDVSYQLLTDQLTDRWEWSDNRKSFVFNGVDREEILLSKRSLDGNFLQNISFDLVLPEYSAATSHQHPLDGDSEFNIVLGADLANLKTSNVAGHVAKLGFNKEKQNGDIISIGFTYEKGDDLNNFLRVQAYINDDLLGELDVPNELLSELVGDTLVNNQNEVKVVLPISLTLLYKTLQVNVGGHELLVALNDDNIDEGIDYSLSWGFSYSSKSERNDLIVSNLTRRVDDESTIRMGANSTVRKLFFLEPADYFEGGDSPAVGDEEAQEKTSHPAEYQALLDKDEDDLSDKELWKLTNYLGLKEYWKPTYTRGVGTISDLACGPDRQYEDGLCYKRSETPPGYTCIALTCWENCGSSDTDTGIRCENLYGNGVGKVQKLYCNDGEELDGLLCYTACKSGYDGVGPVCWEDDLPWHFVFHAWDYSYGRGVGRAASLSCDSGLNNIAGLCYAPCRDGYSYLGGNICTASFTKNTRSRSIGIIPTACAEGMEYDAGLCYPANSKDRYECHGPVCWKSCDKYYIDAGAKCSTSIAEAVLGTTGRTFNDIHHDDTLSPWQKFSQGFVATLELISNPVFKAVDEVVAVDFPRETLLNHGMSESEADDFMSDYQQAQTITPLVAMGAEVITDVAVTVASAGSSSGLLAAKWSAKIAKISAKIASKSGKIGKVAKIAAKTGKKLSGKLNKISKVTNKASKNVKKLTKKISDKFDIAKKLRKNGKIKKVTKSTKFKKFKKGADKLDTAQDLAMAAIAVGDLVHALKEFEELYEFADELLSEDMDYNEFAALIGENMQVLMLEVMEQYDIDGGTASLSDTDSAQNSIASATNFVLDKHNSKSIRRLNEVLRAKGQNYEFALNSEYQAQFLTASTGRPDNSDDGVDLLQATRDLHADVVANTQDYLTPRIVEREDVPPLIESFKALKKGESNLNISRLLKQDPSFIEFRSKMKMLASSGNQTCSSSEGLGFAEAFFGEALSGPAIDCESIVDLKVNRYLANLSEYVFNLNADTDEAISIVKSTIAKLEADDYGYKVNKLTNTVMGGTNLSAMLSDKKTASIFINESLLIGLNMAGGSKAPVPEAGERLSKLFIEEYGHYLDWHVHNVVSQNLNTDQTETAGDEGKRFRLAMGSSIDLSKQEYWGSLKSTHAALVEDAVVYNAPGQNSVTVDTFGYGTILSERSLQFVKNKNVASYYLRLPAFNLSGMRVNKYDHGLIKSTTKGRSREQLAKNKRVSKTFLAPSHHIIFFYSTPQLTSTGYSMKAETGGANEKTIPFYDMGSRVYIFVPTFLTNGFANDSDGIASVGLVRENSFGFNMYLGYDYDGYARYNPDPFGAGTWSDSRHVYLERSGAPGLFVGFNLGNLIDKLTKKPAATGSLPNTNHAKDFLFHMLNGSSLSSAAGVMQGNWKLDRLDTIKARVIGMRSAQLATIALDSAIGLAARKNKTRRKRNGKNPNKRGTAILSASRLVTPYLLDAANGVSMIADEDTQPDVMYFGIELLVNKAHNIPAGGDIYNKFTSAEKDRAFKKELKDSAFSALEEETVARRKQLKSLRKQYHQNEESLAAEIVFAREIRSGLYKPGATPGSMQSYSDRYKGPSNALKKREQEYKLILSSERGYQLAEFIARDKDRIAILENQIEENKTIKQAIIKRANNKAKLKANRKKLKSKSRRVLNNSSAQGGGLGAFSEVSFLAYIVPEYEILTRPYNTLKNEKLATAQQPSKTESEETHTIRNFNNDVVAKIVRTKTVWGRYNYSLSRDIGTQTGAYRQCIGSYKLGDFDSSDEEYERTNEDYRILISKKPWLACNGGIPMFGTAEPELERDNVNSHATMTIMEKYLPTTLELGKGTSLAPLSSTLNTYLNNKVLDGSAVKESYANHLLIRGLEKQIMSISDANGNVIYDGLKVLEQHMNVDSDPSSVVPFKNNLNSKF